MKFVKKTLPNKLRIVTSHMPSLASTTVAVWVATGSRYENEKVGGISHFLEHMVFKGSKKRPSAKAISEAVDSFGGEFNAGTSKEWTNFYIKARNEKMSEAYDVLADMVLNPLLKEEEIEREKGTIIQEIAMYEDTPMAKIGDVFENLIYKNSRLGNDVIGTSKSVMNTKRKDFLSYRETHYHPKNIFVTVAGGSDMSEVYDLTNNYFSTLPDNGKFIKPNEKFVQDGPKTLVKFKKTDQVHLMIGFLGTKYGDKDRYIEAVLSTILGGGMSSRMFLEVRERRGLAYAVRAFTDSTWDTGHFSVYAGVKINKTDEAIKVILDEFYGIASGKKKVSGKELKKAKEYIKGHVALSLEDTKSICSFAAQEMLYKGKLRTPEEVYRKIDKVTADEVLKLAKKLFVKNNLNLATIGPFKDEQKFDELLNI